MLRKTCTSVEWNLKHRLWKPWVGFIRSLPEHDNWGDSLSYNSKELFWTDWGRASIHVILAKDYGQSSIHLCKCLLLVTRNNISVNDFSAFLSMETCKNQVHENFTWSISNYLRVCQPVFSKYRVSHPLFVLNSFHSVL